MELTMESIKIKNYFDNQFIIFAKLGRYYVVLTDEESWYYTTKRESEFKYNEIEREYDDYWKEELEELE